MRARAVSIVLRRNRILLMRRKKADTQYVTLPGGGVEPGETVRQACLRELREETGLSGTIMEELWSIRNRGRVEHYFVIGEVTGELRLAGPEAEVSSRHNQYELTWMDIAHLAECELKPKLIQNRLITRFGA